MGIIIKIVSAAWFDARLAWRANVCMATAHVHQVIKSTMHLCIELGTCVSTHTECQCCGKCWRFGRSKLSTHELDYASTCNLEEFGWKVFTSMGLRFACIYVRV